MTSADPALLALLEARVERAAEARRALHDDLAVRIAGRIGELFSGVSDA